MSVSNSRTMKPSMSVDFDQLREAKTDASIARLYRTQWGLDCSKTGKLFCDEAECQERLDSGSLPPVLTAAQFSRISQGQPYGDMDDDPDPFASIEVARSGAPSSVSPHVGHPLYREYNALPKSVKEALRNDFTCFLFVKQRGTLDAVIGSVYERLAREAQQDAQAARKREQERAVAEAMETPRGQAMKELLEKRRSDRRTK